jgi:hypothetical protein
MTETGTSGLRRRIIADALSAEVLDSKSSARSKRVWGSRGDTEDGSPFELVVLKG